MKMKAFTLIELISTVVIIAIIASLATVSINQVRSSIKDNNTISQLTELQLDLESYRLLHEKYPDSLLDLNNYAKFEDISYIPSAAADNYQLSFDLNKGKNSFSSGYNCISSLGSCYSSLYFDGVDDYIEIEQSGPLTAIESGEITILAWLKIDSSVGEKAIVFTGGGWQRKGVFFTINGTSARFQIGNGSQESYASVGTVPVNEWTLVGGMWKDGVIYHIVNNNIINATNCSFGYYYNPNFNLSIGRVVANTGSSQRFMKFPLS